VGLRLGLHFIFYCCGRHSLIGAAISLPYATSCAHSSPSLSSFRLMVLLATLQEKHVAANYFQVTVLQSLLAQLASSLYGDSLLVEDHRLYVLALSFGFSAVSSSELF
jgi:hypothetical protein